MKQWKKLSLLWEPFTPVEFYIYSACASFYLLLSILPACVLALSVIPYLPVSQIVWDAIITQLIPSPLQTLAVELLRTVFQASSGLIVSASVFTTLWSASKGVLSMMDGLNAVAQFPRLKNFVRRQIKAIVSFFILGSGIISISIILVFGDAIMGDLLSNIPLLYRIYQYRAVISWLFMTGAFMLVYRLLPSNKIPIKYCALAACLVAAAWILFSHMFSIYVSFFSAHRRIYGGIGLLLLTAIWLRVCMLMVLYGGKLAKLVADDQYHPIRIIHSAWESE